MPFLTFIILNGLAATSAFLVTFRILHPVRIIDQAACWFLGYLAISIVSVMALGIDGVLTLRNLLVLHTLALSLLFLYTRNSRQTAFTPAPFFASLRSLQSNRMLRLGFLVIIVFGLMKLYTNLTNAPLGWDCLNYHFVFPVEWIHHANIQVPITINDDPGPTYYPLNGSFWYFWLMIPFRNAFLANAGQIPFFILIFVMIYATGRCLGLHRSSALIPAILFILIPNVFKHLKLAYVDMMVAAYFMAAAYFLIRLKNQYKRGEVIGFALSAGLLLGTKTVALPYSVLLLVPFVIISLAATNRRHWILFATACLLIFVFGSFSYIRTWIETGNPIYPLHLTLFNKVILKGVVNGITYRAHFTAGDYSLMKILFHEGLGAQTLLFILPGALCAFPVWLFKKEKRRSWITGYILLLPLLIFGIYRFILPLANTRYLYPCLSLGIVSAFILVNLLKINQRIIIFVSTLCILASIPELDKNTGLTIGIIATAILYIFSCRPWFYKRMLFFVTTPAVWIIACCFAMSGLYVLGNSYEKLEYRRYRTSAKLSGFWPEAIAAWDWLNQNTTGNTIAYVGRPVPYPLYGSHYKNSVRYVSVNTHEPAKLHYYPESWYSWGFDFESQHKSMEQDTNYRGKADYAVWLKNLRNANTDFLFIYSLHQTKEIMFPIEETWAQSHRDIFTNVFSNDIIRIYALKR
ncbi:MAG TPA: hypothetical protein PKL77_05390 [Candidatus Omnitrophota bacterium]|nr:hypothetical protein [Candidatus Omnitrophota bacterium]HPT07777.1 hypothetical protein [Candidatus Omnitrophota bacterium]